MNKQLFIAIGTISILVLSACGTAQTSPKTTVSGPANPVISGEQATQTKIYKSLQGDWKGLNKHKKTVLKLVLNKVSANQKDLASLTGVAYLPLAVEGEGPYTVSGQIKSAGASSSAGSNMELNVQFRKSSNVYYKLNCNNKQSTSNWKCELENMPSEKNGMSNKRVSKFSLNKIQ